MVPWWYARWDTILYAEPETCCEEKISKAQKWTNIRKFGACEGGDDKTDMSEHHKVINRLSKSVTIKRLFSKQSKRKVKARLRNKLILLNPTQMSFLSFTCASTPSDRTARRMSLPVACRSNEARGR